MVSSNYKMKPYFTPKCSLKLNINNSMLAIIQATNKTVPCPTSQKGPNQLQIMIITSNILLTAKLNKFNRLSIMHNNNIRHLEQVQRNK